MLDTLVFDIQDINNGSTRTFLPWGWPWRQQLCYGKRFVVLDRPNAIGGLTVAGPVLDAGSESFVGYHPICVQHGMTVGELATMFAAEKELGSGSARDSHERLAEETRRLTRPCYRG
ncbi:MAG: DUF1343 domain-containing protein [Pirellulaceae bacterium]